jgi:hypothetical protein
MGSATTFRGGQIIKCNGTSKKFFRMSNPFFCSDKMSITMCLGIDKPSRQIVCCFAKFVNFNAKQFVLFICIFSENYRSPL